ncbi:MAG: diguanylate cyclase [Chloroflexota bacterium]|nr:diguanylate cyclase [Chloroflexota bacterium]
MRILIAEDDAVSRTILERAVRRLGHQPLVASDGAQAWELFRASGADVVISDRTMPGIDGLELFFFIVSDSTEIYTYFVFLTALGDKEHLLAGMRAGADDYLTKPLNRDELEVGLIAARRMTALHRQLADHRTALLGLNVQLAIQARRDPLTQLGNRLQLWEDLATRTTRAQRYGHSYGIALFDVDHFKRYNDRYGHPAGDEVLRKVAAALAGSCRGGDIAYRYGGEEFLIILPEQSLDSALVAAERVRQTVRGLHIPHAGNGPTGLVTLSGGVAVLGLGEGRTSETVVQEADEALYQAKEFGRDRVCVYQDAVMGLTGQAR